MPKNTNIFVKRGISIFIKLYRIYKAKQYTVKIKYFTYDSIFGIEKLFSITCFKLVSTFIIYDKNRVIKRVWTILIS